MKKKTLLIADDEPKILEFLNSEFDAEYTILNAGDGQKCLDLARGEKPDLILMDLMMPVLSGLETCRLLKDDSQTSAIPILILSGRTEIEYLLDAFEIGAEDYIEKPFRIKELRARIVSKLKEKAASPASAPANGPMKLGNLTLDRKSFSVLVEDKALKFSRSEFKLLEFLVENVGQVVTRAEILKKVWAKESVAERTVDIYLVKVRKKLENCDHEIAMIYGAGYLLRPKPHQ